MTNEIKLTTRDRCAWCGSLVPEVTRHGNFWLICDACDKQQMKVFKSYLPEDKEIGCGYWKFKLRANHPFTPACQWHDDIFEAKEQGKTTYSRNRADKGFLNAMLKIAAERKSRWLKIQAYVLWGLARTFGRIVW